MTRLLATVALVIGYSVVWVLLEKKIYGKAEPRKVDDIIMMLLVPIFWLATKGL